MSTLKGPLIRLMLTVAHMMHFFCKFVIGRMSKAPCKNSLSILSASRMTVKTARRHLSEASGYMLEFCFLANVS